MEGTIDGQRQWDQEEATASKVLTLSSLASGGRRGMTDHQGQGAAWADTDPLWGGPINTVDSQHPGTWYFKAAVATDTSWSSWPEFPKSQWWQEEIGEESSPCSGSPTDCRGEQLAWGGGSWILGVANHRCSGWVAPPGRASRSQRSPPPPQEKGA